MKALLGLVSCTGMITISHERVNSLRGKVAYVEQKVMLTIIFLLLLRSAYPLVLINELDFFDI